MDILLVEDNRMLSTSIASFLNIKGFGVTSCFDGEVAISRVDRNDYDLYIIDINIPHINGLDVVKYIRQKDFATPIIIITASVEYQNFEKAYKNGCSEYIKKPFHLKELDVLIHKQLQLNKKNILNISDDIMYNPDTSDLFIADNTIHLRKQESRLLHILLQNANAPVHYQDIIDYVWENEIKEKYFLRQIINKLRKTLPQNRDFIKTHAGIGYSFEIPDK
jgi:DNA-binding response OmpR family regulator